MSPVEWIRFECRNVFHSFCKICEGHPVFAFVGSRLRFEGHGPACVESSVDYSLSL